MTPTCGNCGKENAPDTPFCTHCRARLGQERDHAVRCGCGAETWLRSGLCEACSAHEDEVGQRWADHFAECRDDLDDMRPLDVLELG